MKKVLFIACSLTLTLAFACAKKPKEGCTVPSSPNYDPEAESNDGSCLYDTSVPEDDGTGDVTLPEIARLPSDD
tara:strand:+ start:10455 stop:10676 length:222 start_codon:yes stop_codon:yes gene_type:complete